MQFKIKLRRNKEKGFLPANYRYEISKGITNLLEEGCNVTGEKVPTHRIHELGPFTFGNLHFDAYELLSEGELIAHNGEEASLDIRFLIDKDEEDLVTGPLLNQRIKLGDCHYQIVELKSMGSIEFQDVMAYKCLCPISLCSKNSNGGLNYLSPTDRNFHRFFKVHLIQKVLRSHPEISGLKNLDQYCPEFQFQLLTAPEMKGFPIRTSDEERQDVVGYQFDFQLKASPVLHELGFYEGFGLQHSMGLGFVEVIS